MDHQKCSYAYFSFNININTYDYIILVRCLLLFVQWTYVKCFMIQNYHY